MQQSSFYRHIVLTAKSYDFVRAVIAGKQMRFSKVQIGDGEVTDQNLEQMTELIHYVMDAEILAVTRDGDQATVHVKFNSDEIRDAFMFREVGIYAEIEGEEILFAYLNTGDKFEYLTPSSDGQVFTHKLQFAIGVGNADNVEIVFSDTSLVEGSITEEMLGQSVKDYMLTTITGITDTLAESLTELTDDLNNLEGVIDNHANAKISDMDGVHGIKFVESEDTLKITTTDGSTASFKPGVDPDLLLSDLLTGLNNCISKVGSTNA